MKLLDAFYIIKPLIPRPIQLTLRKARAKYKRYAHKNVWPINPAAGKQPVGWTGWPSRKGFALVLNHDVDTYGGLCKVAKLVELEERLGFRSSFNFVPEDYPTPAALRKRLHDSGFEVGVHGLRHDGRLFKNPKEFYLRAIRIDHYLKEWGAVGLTSPSMHRNLSLMAELDIEHGCSSFDTDPFEPQSDGVGSIFPFYATNARGTRSYIELPYTLPQDHGLFIILKETDNRIWKDKLDWLVANGGMALLNSHPDYMNFDPRRCSLEEYPAKLYSDFLEYIKAKYEGQYWHALPREIASFWRRSAPFDGNLANPREQKGAVAVENKARWRPQESRSHCLKIWIDLDNTPHIPFFMPIIDELKRRGHEVILTARDAFQVCELADEYGIQYVKVGRHYGKNPAMKIAGLLLRSLQLLPFCIHQRPGLALSHGGRSQILLCNLLRIPTILLCDYEHARPTPMSRPKWMLVPESLFGSNLPIRPDRLRFYRGIKEDVYVPGFRPDSSLYEELGVSRDEIIITARPPANEAHYYNPESEKLFVEFMSRACQSQGVRIILLPRNHLQEEGYRVTHPDWFVDAKTSVPPKAVNGLNLIWLSDLVVSGGGTMNREAAALGMPVYSVFRGMTGAVDRTLELEGRLKMIRNVDEIWTSIPLTHRDRNIAPDTASRPALKDIVDHVEDIARIEEIGSRGPNRGT
jgi:hypothetical protein